MLQQVDGRNVYIVDIPNQFIPLPIRAHTLEEAPYAAALQNAIEKGLVSGPGKYAIEVIGTEYLIFAVIEK